MSENSAATTVENSGQLPSTQDLDHSKHRRLVPQFSLTSQNLGSENSRGRVAQNEPSRKTVTRYTREQLIALRKSSKILPSMTVMTEISSVTQLDPVCFTKLEPEDVIRICSVKESTVRGRGRRPYQKGDDELDNENGKGYDELENSKSSSLWDDDVKNTEGEFNLADIAQASLKFRSDTESMRGFGEAIDSKFDSILSSIEVHETVPLEITTKTEEVEVANQETLSPSIGMNEPSLNDNLQLIFGSSLNLIPNPLVNEFTRSAPIVEEPFVFPLSTPSSNSINSSSIFPTSSAIESFPLKVEWFYTDPQQQVQGPFSQENMRLWNEAGYFGNDLPIKLNGWSKFHLFQDVFPEPKLAFYGVPKEPAPLHFSIAEIIKIPEPAIRSPVNIKPLETSGIEEKSKLNNQEEKLVYPVATVKAVEINPSLSDSHRGFEQKQSNAKTDFAKQLLGINRSKSNSSKDESSEIDRATAQVEAPAISSSDAEKATKKSKTVKGWVEETAPKSSMSLVQIQQEEMKRSEDVASPVDASTRSVQLKSLLGLKTNDQANKAWSSSVDSVATTSLTEIMNEEINKQKKVSSDTVPPPLTWASKAKPIVPTKSVIPPQTATTIKNPGEFQPVSKPSGQSTNIHVASSQVKSDFGGKQMSKEMSDWCSAQLKKINGSNDLTLMEFCMSLKSPVDIREYFAQYLGSSPQVTNFATEFIKLKEGKRVESLIPVQVHESSNTIKKKRSGVK